MTIMQERKTLSLSKPVQLPLGKSIHEPPKKAKQKSQAELREEKIRAVAKKEADEKKASFLLIKQKRQQLLERLLQDFPNCFSLEDPKPLKQKIHADIQNHLGEEFSKRQLKDLRGCLHRYTNSKQYHQSMLVASHRIDLNGNPVEETSQEHREHSKQRLSRFVERDRKKNIKKTFKKLIEND